MLFRLFVSGIPYWLRVEDGISMACSIETRVPYLDHELIDHSFKYSSEKIFFNGVNKSQLRRVASCLLPSHIKDLRTKQQRPGNSARIIFDVLFDEAVDSFSECNIFISPDLSAHLKETKTYVETQGFGLGLFWQYGGIKFMKVLLKLNNLNFKNAFYLISSIIAFIMLDGQDYFACIGKRTIDLYYRKTTIQRRNKECICSLPPLLHFRWLMGMKLTRTG